MKIALREGNWDVGALKRFEHFQVRRVLNLIVVIGFDPVAVSNVYGRVAEILDSDLRLDFWIDSLDSVRALRTHSDSALGIRAVVDPNDLFDD